MRSCKKCAAPICGDEVALHQKLVCRDSSEFLCINCLAEHFKVPADDLRAMADRFCKAGCMLFPKKSTLK
ncbi:MAG: hypothetical protein IKZ03_06005 [Clostridia bacterium]|nr:hypothetical protein [Clostridia bacterium]